ncbi:t-SNARE [Gloeophyllum trabeum ATCC 11539]|uniref:t-SNARE n=1 Tax=Gloeophyllum trabeum (strain ATCC 11539 / FP-39264 / Madison 617) TaxID=670483 RepID=S7RW70_GLOTA|nr:t-SNARE [Gloeophyllum trabeum ATCC 11539]EPQ57539.1 t-SNARE [Gloeophyllum trabeum ATCC 11539]
MSYAYAPATPAPSEPTTRSRTLLFRSYRDSLPRTSKHRASFQYDPADSFAGDDERQGLIAGSASGSGAQNGRGHVALDVEGEGLPPKWVDITEHVEEILADTKQKIATLDKLHAKHALPGFSDRTAEEREIESLTNEITRNFRTAQTLIQRITAAPSASYPPGPHTSEARAAKNVQRALAAKVQDMSGVFRKKQRVYMEKLQGHAIKNQDLLIASGTISPPLRGHEAMHSLDEDVQATALAHLPPDPALATRTRELHQLADSIAALADLFKDLSALVIDQGTLLDSVEYNIETAAARVEEGARELQVATRYQKNTGRRRCIFLLVLVIVLLVVVLVVKPKRRGRGAAPVPEPTGSVGEAVSIPMSVRFGGVR